MPSDAQQHVTAAEFLTHPAAAGPSELVRGIIRMMTPASGMHGVIAGRIFVAISAFVEANQLGFAFPDNTGFELSGLAETVRSPDVAFVSRGRLAIEDIGPGWVRATPDLVVEILSPSESVASLEAKLDDYRTAGTRIAWIVDPIKRTVTIRDLAVDFAEQVLTEGETVDAAPVLPGLSMSIAPIFAGLSR